MTTKFNEGDVVSLRCVVKEQHAGVGPGEIRIAPASAGASIFVNVDDVALICPASASPSHAAARSAELLAFAKEYENYSKTMPSDPFALRWRIIGEALRFQAKAFEAIARVASEDSADPAFPDAWDRVPT